jgi:hypothetical protein
MNEQEKNASIEYILSKGLVTPQTAWERLTEMTRTIGFRYIFWDTGYSLFFAAVTLAIVLALFIIVHDDYRYSASVTVAPLMFLLITVFTETSERASGLYELKQTCRYTICQITALRVACYSVLGAAFTTVIAVISAKDAYEFLVLFPLCLSALFVCAALSLTIMRFIRSKWAHAVFSAAWVFVCIALAFSLKRWDTLLSGTPVILSVVIAVFGAAILAYQISRMLSEVDKYAVA